MFQELRRISTGHPDEIIIFIVDGDAATGTATLNLDGGRSVDYALVFADRAQKVQLAKLPDAQGLWPELPISPGAWVYVKPTSTSKTNAARFTIRTPSNMLRLATELVHVGCDSGNPHVAAALCTTATLAALTASLQSEVGVNRLRVMGALTHVFKLWAANPALNRFDQAPPSLYLHRFAATIVQACVRRGELPMAANSSSAAGRERIGHPTVPLDCSSHHLWSLHWVIRLAHRLAGIHMIFPPHLHFAFKC